MKKDFNQVYQFKITLKDTKPPVWRRIQVPETNTFWDLHVAIQDSMGWLDCHLHAFQLIAPSTGRKREIGIPDDEVEFDRDTLAGWKQKIADWFSPENPLAQYLYDFGDGWIHEVRLEKVLPRQENVIYPVCLDGKRACPPEDCGGIWGYEEICKGESEFQDEYADYDPEYFNPEDITFDDSKKRFREAFG